MKHASKLIFVLLLAVTAIHRRADAQPAQTTVDTASARADDLAHKGNDFALKEKWTEAEALFKQAWALKQSYDIGGNLGIAELALGKYRDAAEHLSFALAHFPANGKPEHRDLLRENVAKARAQVGARTIVIGAQGAEVFVDGKSIGVTPLPGEVFLEPGTRTIEARLAGHEPARKTVEVAKGSAETIKLELRPEGPAPQPPGGPSKPVIVTGAALGGAGVILGAVFAGLSDAKASDATAKNDALLKTGLPVACGPMPSATCQAIQSALQARATFANASAWSFIAGGALGVGTVIYALAAPRSAKTSGMRVAPLVVSGGGGVVLQGEW